MKKTTTLAILPATAFAVLAFTSCASMDPEYKAWKDKQKAAAATTTNPYGAPAASTTNPYGVPQSGGEAGTYTPAAGGAAPYQPLPGVAQQATPAAPYTPTPAAPTTGGASHTVVAGDSLWALAKTYGTSVEAIQSANGLTDTVIRTGQTLIIPSR